MARVPAFLITIDTEGDNLWSGPATITTENSRFLERFQRLAERYGLLPTWLTTHEMAQCQTYSAFAKDYLHRGTGELGMHLHAWNSPPLDHTLSSNDSHALPYLIEYPAEVMQQKITHLTDLLQSRFGTRPRSHRAGRWAMDARYAKSLAANGYIADCSVTPGVSWRHFQGDPNGNGGTDYRRFPNRPYRMDVDHIDREDDDSPLWEIPVTIVQGPGKKFERVVEHLPPLARKAANRLLPPAHWLRPNGRNLDSMLSILDLALEENHPCVTFMLHSSELMPGGSPKFASVESIEKLYSDLEVLFGAASSSFRGATLTAFTQSLDSSQ
ncbi:MAG: hypothetical protein P8X82_08685 [Gemmatimonadales bacterium]